MVEKTAVSSQQTSTFVCPKCQKSKTVNVSQYAGLDKIIKVNVRCPCGFSYITILDKRRQYRKETNLDGIYTRIVNGQETGGGPMTVKDLSTGGLKLQISENHGCTPGDVVKVEFRLDDIHKSLIRRKVIVRNIHQHTAGMEFITKQAVDKTLGFYLFK